MKITRNQVIICRRFYWKVLDSFLQVFFTELTWCMGERWRWLFMSNRQETQIVPNDKFITRQTVS
jgi:hypothetical protein